MSGFNLSEWAIRHRSLVVFFMLVLAVAGVGSYLRLGRKRGSGLHDPDHGGAGQLARRHDPGHAPAGDGAPGAQAQETPNLDYLRSYTSAGQSTVFVNLNGSTPGKAIPDIWYQVRKKIGDIRNTLPQGIVGPASTTSSATPTASSTVSRRTASAIAS